MSVQIGDSIDSSAKLFKHCWCIVDLRYFSMSLSLAKLFSPEATVKGVVSNILSAMHKFGNAERFYYKLDTASVF